VRPEIGRSTAEATHGFEPLAAGFARALETRPDLLAETFCTFAGRPARLRAVGRDLADRLGRPFAHLQTDDRGGSPAELCIDLWDASATGISPPRMSTAAPETWRTWSVNGGTLGASVDGREIVFQFRDSLTCLDRETQRIVGCVTDSTQLSLYERGKPLQLLLSAWHQDRDVMVLHAAMVAREGRGVLLPGKGGIGKSTSALACLSGGFSFLGDDYIGLETRGGLAFLGHSLYGSTWLEPSHATRFPELVDWGIRGTHPDEVKLLVLLSEIYPARLMRVASIRAIALPRIRHGEHSCLRPATKTEALLQLAPSSLLMVLGPGARGLERLAQLVDRVPCHWLELGRDLGEIPERVAELLDRVAGP